MKTFLHTLVFVIWCILVGSRAFAMDCYSPLSEHGFMPVTYIEGRGFYAHFATRESAENFAFAYGLCIEEYGVIIDDIDTESHQTTNWIKTNGYSVWENTIK